MKLTIFLCVILAIVVATTEAQRCRAPNNQVCIGPKNEGRGGRGCRAAVQWWYSRRDGQCLRMNYKGCGGNNNRYCTKQDCERRCRRGG